MKKKLFVSVMSLVMAVILMTSTSFAWFTVSQTATTGDLQVSMAAVTNVEIAKGADQPQEVTADDSGNEGAWGATIGFTATSEMKNLATYDGGIMTVKYGTDGRTAGLEAAASAGSGDATIYTNGKGENVAICYDFWVRSNTGSVNYTITPPSGAKATSLLVVGGTAKTGNTGTFSCDKTNGVHCQMFLYYEGGAGGYVAKDVVNGFTAEKYSITFTPGTVS